MRLASVTLTSMLLVLVLSHARPALAQGTGTISGTVTDSSDQVLPGAVVTLTHEQTADHRAVTSDARGEFSFQAVPAGSYTLAVELAGFRKYVRKNTILETSAQMSAGRTGRSLM